MSGDEDLVGGDGELGSDVGSRISRSARSSGRTLRLENPLPGPTMSREGPRSPRPALIARLQSRRGLPLAFPPDLVITANSVLAESVVGSSPLRKRSSGGVLRWWGATVGGRRARADRQRPSTPLNAPWTPLDAL
ncbi:hypothetical protein Krad_2710 [Kineococcus radiotolerans SRS30216 = ATCC BAA-149]|uniref:Uncharacterized protein n=1 Tax=Kineococcus radiotolerans (strain ATCC BAA-149 / DSM 14245 / SRS30216) TaxID=266940 RepID=A6WBJ3_KINRD|nr:hypothetical protein Krad_2710 [Kineococcus radiotolerans SRS30216 = ATCC BAA-149]